MKRPSFAVRQRSLLASALLMAGCASTFEMQLPESHPARPNAPSAGLLNVPNPFDVQPFEGPKADKPPMDDMDDMHGMPGMGDMDGMKDMEGMKGMPGMGGAPEAAPVKPAPDPMSGHMGHGGGH